MAFTTILRRSISSVVPLAVRAVQRNHHHSALFTAVYHSSFTHKRSSRPFSSTLRSSAVEHSSDSKLIRVLEEEIKCAEETDDHDRHEEAPSGFPFELQDNHGEAFVYLSREYQGEVIKVEVGMPSLVTGETDEEYGNDNDNDNANEKGDQSKIPLVVSVSKKKGSFLEFGCTAYPDEITIDSLSIKNPELSEEQIAYEGPDFADLDENLQKAFHKYLEIRGIKPSTINFLHEYMINKDSREYLFWLKNLKKFVEA